MRVCERFVRAVVLVTGLCCVVAGTVRGQAPTVTVSPLSLSFGVPGTTPNVASSSQPISVTVSGPGTATVSISQSGSSDFTETDNCSGAISAPGCVINVTFKPSATGLGLESATWTITPTPGQAATVTLTGALGAVPIFTNPVDVNPSNGNASFSSLVTFGSQSYNLSCPAGSPATLSSLPDGSGKVVVDNYLTVSVGTTPTNQSPVGNQTPAGNVCTGVNDGNSQQPDCFTDAYRNAAGGGGGGGGVDGTDPDTFASTWGVPPINIGGTDGVFSAGGNYTATFNLVDAGVVLTSTRLFLVSQCTVAGVTPGGSVTNNPVTNDPKTQTQTATFDSVGGQTGALTTDVSNSPGSVPSGTTQVTTDFAVPQQLFSQLVKGTSVAPAVCLRLNMEQDTSNHNAPMCKAFLIQCWDPTHTTLTGDNCITTPSAARNLFDATKYDSLDAPQGQNYLLSACSGVNNETCAQATIGGTAATTMLVGPGILLGGDQWLCPFGSGGASSCSNQTDLTTLTSPNTETPSYDPGNCKLTGTLLNDPCPLDTLTQFKGAADPVHGSTTNGKNSMFIPVTNVPLPFTQTVISGRNGNGWVTNPTVGVTFTSNHANYIPAAGNPDANGFVAAPPYSVTYGVALASTAAPDTTFPVPNDTTVLNPTGANANFGPPTCGSNTAGSFTTPLISLGETAGNIYNLHYFTTDCALTEELLFKPTTAQLSDANANWASFRTIAFGIDNVAPGLSCPNPPSANGSNGWYKTLPTVSCQATDDFSGFDQSANQPTASTAAPNVGCDPTVYPDCVVKMGVTLFNYNVSATGSGASTQFPQQVVQDLAGNSSPKQGPFLTPLDGAAPTFSVQFSAGGTNFTVGQNVTAKFSCSDDVSGLAMCGNQVFACPTAPAVNPLTFANSTGIAIDTSAAAVGTHVLNAVDCAGNVSATSVSYTVSYGSAELLIANVPNPLATIKTGNNLTYNIFVLNLSGNTASNVVVTDTLPAGTSVVGTPIANIGSCTTSGCAQITSGSSCGVSGNVVTCSTPTLKPLLPGFTGFVIKLVVKVTEPASVKSISDTATVSSANPDPIKGDNSVTVTTKVTQ